jgi:hypothetical protein
MDHNRWKTGDFQVQPNELFKEMRTSVKALLEARVLIRSVHEKLSSVVNDASGIVWTDNYSNPEIRKARDALYSMDFSLGETFRTIERLERDMKKMVV